jgi:hypothetical protein
MLVAAAVVVPVLLEQLVPQVQVELVVLAFKYRQHSEIPHLVLELLVQVLQHIGLLVVVPDRKERLVQSQVELVVEVQTHP